MATVRVPHKARRDRGLRTEKVGAAFWRRVWPKAAHKGGSSPGRDLLFTTGCAIEIKARRDFDPMEWLRQADRSADGDEIPFVMWRPDGYGEAQVGRWPVMLRSEHLAVLLIAAGVSGRPVADRIELTLLRHKLQQEDPAAYAALLLAVSAQMAPEAAA